MKHHLKTVRNRDGSPILATYHGAQYACMEVLQPSPYGETGCDLCDIQRWGKCAVSRWKSCKTVRDRLEDKHDSSDVTWREVPDE